MEPPESSVNHQRLVKAYLRLAEEAKRIKESPGVIGIKGRPEHKPKRKEKKRNDKQSPLKQQRMF